jgi:hypothetical protein
MKPRTLWLPADAELPVRAKRTIASEKRMLIVFCAIHAIADYCWLPKDSTLESSFLYEDVLNVLSTRSENAAKFQKTRKPLTLTHMDNARVHAARATQEKLNVSRFKRMQQPPYSPDIASSDFLFSLG